MLSPFGFSGGTSATLIRSHVLVLAPPLAYSAA